MLKTRLLYQWNSDKKGEIVEKKGKPIQIDRNGLIYFIQILSSSPIDILSEKQNQKH